MARIALYKDNYADSTVVSNLFIDEYMKDANDAQLKVYFYLLRMLNADQAISVSGIADKFNHTEKDVIRALKYWEKQQILDLDFDENKALVGIHLRDLSAQATPASQHNVLLTSGPVQTQNTAGNSIISAAVAQPVQPAPQETTPVYNKPAYSLDQLREFKEREETSQLLFIAEAYIGKPLAPSEIKTILFFTDVLHFSDDLIDYLLQYCVERGKKDFKYIEKVAVNWAEEGITTPKQAQKFSTRYDKSVYSIMNSLGRSTAPTAKELEFINRWTREYGFSTDIILEACERSSLATDRHRFEYAEGILSSWKNAGIHHKADIQQADATYQKKKATKPAPAASSNRFTQFAQNSYDFAALEKEILSN
jgi:DnaD/phage-associated family protein